MLCWNYHSARSVCWVLVGRGCSCPSSVTYVRTACGASAMRAPSALYKCRVSVLCKFVAPTWPSCLLTFSVTNHVGLVTAITHGNLSNYLYQQIQVGLGWVRFFISQFFEWCVGIILHWTALHITYQFIHRTYFGLTFIVCLAFMQEIWPVE